MSVMMQPLHSTGNSVTAPAAVMRPILAGAPVNSVPSVNQRLPSEPLVMARGWLFAVGTLNCFSTPTGAASAAVCSDNARPPASTVASARPIRRDMIPPLIRLQRNVAEHVGVLTCAALGPVQVLPESSDAGRS